MLLSSYWSRSAIVIRTQRSVSGQKQRDHPLKHSLKWQSFYLLNVYSRPNIWILLGCEFSFDVRVHGDGGTEMAGACLWLSYIGAAEKMSRNEWEMWEKLFNTIIGSEQSCWPGLGCTRQQTIYLVISLLDSNNSNTRLWGLECLDSIFPVRQVTRVMLVILVLSVMLVMLVTLCWPCSRWGGGTRVLTVSSQ